MAFVGGRGLPGVEKKLFFYDHNDVKNTGARDLEDHTVPMGGEFARDKTFYFASRCCIGNWGDALVIHIQRDSRYDMSREKGMMRARTRRDRYRRTDVAFQPTVCREAKDQAGSRSR